MKSLLVDSMVEGQRFPETWDDFWARKRSSTHKTQNESSPRSSRSDEESQQNNAMLLARAIEELGPTYSKFAQAASSRTDLLPQSLSSALATLQDQMEPFDSAEAKMLIRKELLRSDRNCREEDVLSLIDSLSETPVAAASIGQVYKGVLRGEEVAVKVKRQGIKDVVEQDAALLLQFARLIESIPALPVIQKDQSRLVETELVLAVEEFMSRILEELDYENEASNIELFFDLYSHNREGENRFNNIDVQVVVPKVFRDFCSDEVIVMEWIEGEKLVDREQSKSADNLELVEQGIECTLSQLLVTGVLHADPHGTLHLYCFPFNDAFWGSFSDEV